MSSGASIRVLACAAVAHGAMLGAMLGDSTATLVVATIAIAIVGLAAGLWAPALAAAVPLTLAAVWLPVALFNDTLPATDPGSGAGEGLAAVFVTGEVAVALVAVLIGAFVTVTRRLNDA